MSIFEMIGIWYLVGLLQYPIFVGYFQREYPSIADDTVWADRAFGLLYALLGPVAVLIAIPMSGFCRHGLKL